MNLEKKEKKMEKVYKTKRIPNIDAKRIFFDDYKRIKNLVINWFLVLSMVFLSYLSFYGFWAVLKKFIKVTSYSESKNTYIFSCLIYMIFLGLIFYSDGVVSSYLKTPASQVNYALNNCVVNGNMDSKTSNRLIRTSILVSDCVRESLKKFGLLTVVSQLKSIFVSSNNSGKIITKTKSGDVMSEKDIENAAWWLMICGDLSVFIPTLMGFYKMYVLWVEIKEQEKLQMKKKGFSANSLKLTINKTKTPSDSN